MRVLLDTHTVIWAGQNSDQLSSRARMLIANKQNERLVSAATAWEVATKVRLGRWEEARTLEADFVEFMALAGFQTIPVGVQEALLAGRLPGKHKDPFDRMLVAQAMLRNIPIVSRDAQLDGFGVQRIW